MDTNIVYLMHSRNQGNRVTMDAFKDFIKTLSLAQLQESYVLHKDSGLEEDSEQIKFILDQLGAKREEALSRVPRMGKSITIHYADGIREFSPTEFIDHIEPLSLFELEQMYTLQRKKGKKDWGESYEANVLLNRIDELKQSTGPVVEQPSVESVEWNNNQRKALGLRPAIVTDYPETAAEQAIIKPAHYQAGEMDVIHFCQHHNVNFSRGTAIKYLVRAGKKPGEPELRDLEKAIEFIQREINYIKGKL